MTIETPVADVVARELRATLARRKMTHAELARAGGLPLSTVSDALQGRHAISIDRFVQLLDALGGEPDDLVRKLVAEIRLRAITPTRTDD